MALKTESYAQETAHKNTLLVRELSKELPPVCARFLFAIEDRTSPLTRLAYARDLRIFFQFLQTECPEFSVESITHFTPEMIDSVTAYHFERYSDYLTYYIDENDTEHSNAELAKQRKLCALRSFYNYCFRNQIVKSDVSRLVELPKRHEKPILRLEIDEVAKLLDTVENGDAFEGHRQKYNEHTRARDLAILTLFLGTGIRVSELVGINIDDIDFSLNAFLVTRKGGSQAILYFPDEVASVLKEYLEKRRKITANPGHENALFLSLQKKRIGVRAVELMVKKYTAQVAPLKTKMSPHKLRSTFGTNLYHETGDIYLVADVLGHSDVNTTRRHYAAMSDDRRRIAAKAVKLRDEPAEDSK